MKEFIALHNRTVSRTQIQEVIQQAKQENNTEVIYRLSKILNEYPNNNRFVINIQNYPQDTIPTALAGTRHLGDYREALDENGRLRKGYKFVKGKIIPTQSSRPSQDNEIAFLAAAGIDYFEEAPDDEPQGLGKPIPAADIYQMITDKIISMLKSTKASDYKKTWEDDAFFIPLNFDSKKPYRGVNRMLLQERIGLTEAFANPYFLTFKQIKKHKGTLKKGAKGYEVVYYSIRYVVPADKNTGRKAYSSTNAHKVIDFIDKHKLPENIVTRIPMIRYYNVYNGEDITGIDFKLPEVKIGRAVPDTAPENQAAALIVENYPNPPAIKHGGNEAYYKLSEDLVRMPKVEQFDSVNDYYRTLFHELTHSTRHESRLNREKISFRFGDTGYAKEELVAEFGAVFLSAWAGIMWYNNKNHAAYLKGWNSAIKEAENDNKFLMKAASLAQQATDYILNLNSAGLPAFLSKYEKPKKKAKSPKEPQKKVTQEPELSTVPETTNDSNNFLYFNIDRSNPQPQPISRVKAKYKNIDFEQEYNRISDKNGYFKPNFNNKRDLQILHALCSDFIGTINTEDYFERAPKSKTTGIMSLKKIVSKDKLRPVLTGVYIDKDYYIATDAFKLIWLPRPKNDEYKTGSIFDLNFKCQKFGGCKPEDALIEGRFPIDSTVNMKNAPIAYTSQQLDITILIDHLYRGEKAIKSLAPYQNPMVIALHINKENIYIDIKNLLDALDVLRANGAKSLTMNFENLSGKSPIHIQTDNKLQALIMARYFATEKDIPTVDTCLMIAPLPLTLTEISKPTKGLSAPADGTLFGKYPEISTDTFKDMKVSELRAFTLSYYLTHLKGKKVAIKNHLKEVIFTTKAGRKIAKGEAMYKEKAAVIERLEELIKNSTYNNWGSRKTQDSPNILGYLNFKSKLTIDGEKRHVRIAISLTRERKTELKNVEVGKKKSASFRKATVVNPQDGRNETLSTNTAAKTVPKNKKVPHSAQDPVGTLQDGRNETLSTNTTAKTVPNNSISKKKSQAPKGTLPSAEGAQLSTNIPAKNVPKSLNAPRHAGILKEALTEKGKLKKGWYFQDYGIIDPKGEYHTLERDYSLEYNLIEKELRSRAFLQDEKRKIKGFEENKELDEEIKVFLRELSKENRKYFKSHKAAEVFYWAFPFTEEHYSTFYTFEESNPYINKRLQELDQYFTDNNELFERLENYETLRRYKLKSLGLDFSTKITSFINKQGMKIRGNSAKIKEKYGLSTPLTVPTVYVEHLPEETNQQINTSANTLDAKMAALQTRNWETFVIANPQMQAFLGDVERKPAESTVITIAGGAGSGKTRFAFQFINALAQNYKVGHASLEEHPDSKLYYDKVQQYIDNTALPNIEAPEIKNLDQLEALIQRNDVIVIDSFAKLQELNPRFLLDRDLRKKYDGKLFLLIYQLTGEGKMRGGSKSEFDGDIILLTHVAPDYRENYIYPSKNRYNALPATALRYSTYYQQMLDIPQELNTGSQPSQANSLPPAPQTNVYEVIY
ncbi:zincin-like metallopeptidase domain-containing protein [Capnocytophaga sp. oral taxon 878]|uniref:zincin-like metallopeptidase domain-containing protein n=1 Tax=Capnocytophaga sp. oral taxon 878 TaxID=1316596 RepID=UPI0013E9DF7E|nr:zincin-like metallopeptidase domain-containing protein [Capnocytophaga sp. oral taxon 878]